VVPGGGLSFDHTRWIPLRYEFLLPVKVLSKVFCGRFIDVLRQAYEKSQLSFHGKCKRLSNKAAFDSLGFHAYSPLRIARQPEAKRITRSLPDST
jgi:hypothetical protein